MRPAGDRNARAGGAGRHRARPARAPVRTRPCARPPTRLAAPHVGPLLTEEARVRGSIDPCSRLGVRIPLRQEEIHSANWAEWTSSSHTTAPDKRKEQA
ncbi:hypothetical protein GCM10022227_46960 [Streptomyces sedi]